MEIFIPGTKLSKNLTGPGRGEEWYLAKTVSKEARFDRATDPALIKDSFPTTVTAGLNPYHSSNSFIHRF